MPDVKPERSGWRDQRLSERHRTWGWDCPAVDLDFLMIEYDNAQPVAIIEYKHENAAPAYPSSASFQAIVILADKSDITFWGVRYANDLSWYKVVPINTLAKSISSTRRTISERDFVIFLYELRGRTAPDEILEQCSSKAPPQEAEDGD